MFGLAAAQTATLIGLVMGILGIILISLPLIGNLKQYRFKKEIAREKKKSGASKIPSYLDEKNEFTAESQIRDIRLVFLGLIFMGIGFISQVLGVLLSN